VGLSASAQQVQGLGIQLASLRGDFDSAAAAKAVWYQTVVSMLENMRSEDRRVVQTAVVYMSGLLLETTDNLHDLSSSVRWLEQQQVRMAYATKTVNFILERPRSPCLTECLGMQLPHAVPSAAAVRVPSPLARCHLCGILGTRVTWRTAWPGGRCIFGRRTPFWRGFSGTSCQDLGGQRPGVWRHPAAEDAHRSQPAVYILRCAATPKPW
jgi:hypothetical protein